MLQPARDARKGEGSRRAGTNDVAMEVMRENLRKLKEAARAGADDRQRILERAGFLKFPKGYDWSYPAPESERVIGKF